MPDYLAGALSALPNGGHKGSLRENGGRCNGINARIHDCHPGRHVVIDALRPILHTSGPTWTYAQNEKSGAELKPLLGAGA